MGVVRGEATPSWGNPGNHRLVLQGALTRGLCLWANSNLLRLQNLLKGSISSVCVFVCGGVGGGGGAFSEVRVAHHWVAR